jgi:isopenicillin N synthase-like dioxygenase
MSASTFPVFDLGRFESATSEERRAMGAEVDDICRSTGFLAIANHGVPQAVIDGVWRKARDFFDLPPRSSSGRRLHTRAIPMAISGPNSRRWRGRATSTARLISRKVSMADPPRRRQA